MKPPNKLKRLEKRLAQWKKSVSRSQHSLDPRAYHQPGSMNK